MTTNNLFISHAHPDADIARALKALLEDALGGVSVFASSDTASLPLGSKWLPVIEESLSRASLFIVLLSPQSITRPWVNFEAGAAFGRATPLVPVCVRGLSCHHVGPPLNSYHLLDVKEPADVELLVNHIATSFGHRSKIDFRLFDTVFQLARPRTDGLPPPLTASAERDEPKYLAQMQADLDSLTMARKTFWESLDVAYSIFVLGNTIYPPVLNGLVDAAAPPVGVPVGAGEHIRDFPSKYARLLPRASADLWNFCRGVYPAKEAGKTLGDISLVATQTFDSFHEARAQHAKLWNRFAASIYDYGSVSLPAAVARFGALRRLVNLLAYLDLALVHWTQEPGVGKQYLLRLNRDWGRAVDKAS